MKTGFAGISCHNNKKNIKMTLPEIMTVEQVADLLMCDKDRVAERLNRGDIPGTKFGRSWVIPTLAFFQRLNEIALDEADQRRRDCTPPISQRPTEPAKKRGRPRFTGSS